MQHQNTMSYSAAKRLITDHVRAWIMPYEPLDSEEFHCYFALIPLLVNNPSIDLDELCASATD